MAPVRIGSYRLRATLGEGSFGKVKLAIHEPTGRQVAVKILNRQRIRDKRMEEKVKREIKILKMCMHPHVIRLYEVIETSTDIYVVTEYSSGGELFDYVCESGRLQELEARRIFQQIISGVDYCHKHMIAHRDLKLENLLLDENNNVKIADFGLSNKMLDGCFLKTVCGTPHYAAPELISSKLYAGPEVDVWSCGIILYALLCGSLPFDDEILPYLFRRIKSGIYTLPSYLSDLSKDLISKMLVTDPMKRINISEIRRHPWFRENLPQYLASSTQIAEHFEDIIDESIVDRAAKCTQFPRDKIIRNLARGKRNHYTVAYNLFKDEQDSLNMVTLNKTFLDKRHYDDYSENIGVNHVGGDWARKSHHGWSSIDLRRIPRLNTNSMGVSMGSMSDFSLGMGMNLVKCGDVHMGNSLTADSRMNIGACNVGAMSLNMNIDSNLNTDEISMTSTSTSTTYGTASIQMDEENVNSNINANVNDSRGRTVESNVNTIMRERKWDVGIRCGQRNPANAMREVYQALIALKWRWKTLGNEAFKVRVLVDKSESEQPVRMSLQLFKSSSGYQLDVQRTDGDPIAFFAACCELKQELEP